MPLKHSLTLLIGILSVCCSCSGKTGNSKPESHDTTSEAPCNPLQLEGYTENLEQVMIKMGPEFPGAVDSIARNYQAQWCRNNPELCTPFVREFLHHFKSPENDDIFVAKYVIITGGDTSDFHVFGTRKDLRPLVFDVIGKPGSSTSLTIEGYVREGENHRFWGMSQGEPTDTHGRFRLSLGTNIHYQYACPGSVE